MIWFRSLLYLIGQLASAIVVECAILLTFPCPRPVTDQIISSWARFNIWTLKIICKLDYRVQGMEHLPNGPMIVMSNHQSAWETLCFQLLFPPISFVLKRQLLWIPIFGWGLAAYRPVAINRSKKVRALDQLIQQGRDRLSEGRWLIIYPEGTRRNPGSPGTFMAGGAMIAQKTGTPILPVVHNAGVYWPCRSFRKYPGTIDVVIGSPVLPQGKKTREINAEAEHWIRTRMAELTGNEERSPSHRI